ncbi:hypothetical protein FOXB_11720, partial [Fusarium oxysporum f. sp. conglutinans Fo5176]
SNKIRRNLKGILVSIS